MIKQMLFHTYETLDSRNMSEGANVLLQYVADVVPIFIPLLLAVIFSIITFGTFFYQDRNKGKGNLAIAGSVGGMMTTGVAGILSLIPNLVPIYAIMTCIVITSIFVLWLMFPKD